MFCNGCANNNWKNIPFLVNLPVACLAESEAR